MSIEQSLREFVEWWREHITGDEKGEAQIFLDHLMRAFGHAGALEAGRYEERVRRRRNGKTTVSFADYLIPKRVLIEMKKRGEDLRKHYVQLEEYWKSLESNFRPRYAILCDFDEIWIFDFHTQFYDPVDVVKVDELPSERHNALSFLGPRHYKAPVFKNNRVEVTKDAAFQLAELFHSLEDAVDGAIALRFTLQCMVALFAEDVGLLPPATLLNIVEDSRHRRNATDNSHDLMALLFTMMNYPKHVRRAGRFGQVDYFNGGIFQEVHPVFLSGQQLHRLESACREDWSRIRPSIFGNIFEYSMDKRERHREGAHYTSELDIKRIVDPVIAEPWRNDIDSVNELSNALRLYDDLCNYVVLDPACGSGNFLFVAYREMKALESELRERIVELGGDLLQLTRRVTAKQFYGYDINGFAVELAKVSLMIAKKLAADEFDTNEEPLPLDNLDDNIKVEDALFNEWVEFDACIGNPPYLGFRERRKEHSIAYTSAVQDAFSEVHGQADFCVYWFRKAHDNMKASARAGLVGTNTIRQNYSRMGSLDYIVGNDGVIYDAVSSIPWSGEAKVHVSIVNWTKGAPPFMPRRLHLFTGQNEADEYVFRTVDKSEINTSLSEKVDVSGAQKLRANTSPKRVFSGNITGSPGFLIPVAKAEQLVKRDRRNRQALVPYLIGRDLVGYPRGLPSRYVIDFNDLDIIEIRNFPDLYRIISDTVLPVRQQKANAEIRKNKEAVAANPDSNVNSVQQQRLTKWWTHNNRQAELSNYLKTIDRYICCSQVTKRPIFDFVATKICPSNMLKVFAFEDDYTFGILQSDVHWQWFVEKASTLKADYRYTSHSVFDTFPFPQHPLPAQIRSVAVAGRDLHEYRRDHMMLNETLSLRSMYQSLEEPGDNPLRTLHATLDAAVLAVYGFDPDRDILEQLLALNFEVAARIEAGEQVTAPGIPSDYPNPDELVSDGCIQPPDLF
ncbi:MAG: N-6 DNA methylase [Chloroflexota bacterium]|nr:N-6 DNA methylase [Chloroflexota bacterium]MDE2947542.1 N-6 DNA methylase [Chloroflexota bacterium]